MADQTRITQGSSLLLECPDGKVTDAGLTVSVTCSAPDTFDTIAVSADTCRDKATCTAASAAGVVDPPVSHGLICTYTDTTVLNNIIFGIVSRSFNQK